MEEAEDETAFKSKPRPPVAAPKANRAKVLWGAGLVILFLLLTEFVLWKMQRQANPRGNEPVPSAR